MSNQPRRISGNYFDRLLISIAPLFFIAGLLLFWVLPNPDFRITLFGFLSVTLLVWLIESLLIFFRHPVTLSLDNEEGILIGGRRVQKAEIRSIRRLHINTKLTYYFIEFRLMDDTTFRVLDKPGSIFDSLKFKPDSGTLKALFVRYPALKQKLRVDKFL
jgi:hypothetical protein